MGTGYTRNDTVNNIADGNVINASDLDGEFDAIQAAFNASTGHSHDGTSGEGPQINTDGLADDAVTAAKLDETESYTVAGVTVTGTAAFNGNTTIGNADTDTVTVTADVASNLVPSADGTYDLGAIGSEWNDAFITGTANIDALVADSVDIAAGEIDGVTLGTNSAVTEAQIDNININGNTIISSDTDGAINLTPNGTGSVVISKADINAGTIDNTAIGATTASTGNFSTLSLNGTAVTSTAAELNILDGVTSTAAELNILDGATLDVTELNILDGVTSTTAELNILDGVTATATELNYLDITTLGTSEASKAITADANNDTVVSGSVRGTVTTDNDLSFDMNATNNFKCTPSTGGALTFTNITSGQSGNIWLDNSAGVTITAAATTYIAAADLTTISTAGVYFLSYYADGTNVLVACSQALTSQGA